MRHSSASLATVVPSRLKKSSSRGDTSSAVIAAICSALAIRHQVIPTASKKAIPKPELPTKTLSRVAGCTVVLRLRCKNYALVFRRADALRIVRTFDTESTPQRPRDGSRDADHGSPRPSKNRHRIMTLPFRGDNSRVSHGLLSAAIQRLREGKGEKRLFSQKNRAHDGDSGGVATLHFLCRIAVSKRRGDL
jgi:hypothetical protein